MASLVLGHLIDVLHRTSTPPFDAGWLGDFRWSPYAVGAGIGILSWCTFLVAKKKIGASSAFAQTVASALGAVAPSHVAKNAYLAELKKDGFIGWETMLLIGIAIGAFLSAWLGGGLDRQFIPQLWAQRFGEHSALLRVGVGFVGGTLLGLGARCAGGCTSGHGVSGSMQLAVSSWLAVVFFFVGGIATAFLLFGGN